MKKYSIIPDGNGYVIKDTTSCKPLSWIILAIMIVFFVIGGNRGWFEGFKEKAEAIKAAEYEQLEFVDLSN